MRIHHIHIVGFAIVLLTITEGIISMFTGTCYQITYIVIDACSCFTAEVTTNINLFSLYIYVASYILEPNELRIDSMEACRPTLLSICATDSHIL